MIQQQGTGRPSVAVMMLQPQCNMICNFCVTEDSFKSMSFDEAVSMLHHLKAVGVKSLVIGGGEPFAWPHDLIALTEVAKELEFSTVQIGTNAIALPENFESIKSIDRFVLPLESSKAEIHNQMRKYKNKHFSIIIAAMERLKSTAKSLTISTVVTRMNYKDVLGVGEFLRDYHREAQNVHAWHIYQFLPIGRGGEVNAGILSLSEQEYLQVAEEAQNMQLPFKVFKRPQMYNSQTVDFFWEA